MLQCTGYTVLIFAHLDGSLLDIGRWRLAIAVTHTQVMVVKEGGGGLGRIW